MMMLDEVDEWEELLALAVLEGELEVGGNPQVLAKKFGDVAVSADLDLRPRQARSNAWSEEDDQFLRQHLGFLAEDEIAQALGRSTTAVKLRRYRQLNMPPVGNHPDFLNARAAARAIGVDNHTMIRILEREPIPYWRLGSRLLYIMRKVSLYRWAVNPMHWCFFYRSIKNTRRITDPHLRRLIERQKARWNDEWWTPGQVAKYHGVDHTDVNCFIRSGRLGGSAVKFGNWWILRSEAMQDGLYFVKGKGNWKPEWSEEADCFMLIGRALRVMHHELAAMMKTTHKSVAYRLQYMRKTGIAQDVIDKFGLEIDVDPVTGELSASRETYGWMFPRVDWDYRWRQ